VHLVCFTIEIYYDAQPCECQIYCTSVGTGSSHHVIHYSQISDLIFIIIFWGSTSVHCGLLKSLLLGGIGPGFSSFIVYVVC
jgi:hypothetical protein